MSENAEIVAWVCFALGAVILLAGVVIGLILSFAKNPKHMSTKTASKKIEEALLKVDALKSTALAAASEPTADTTAANEATSQAGQLQSVLKEIGGILGSLPENLRFDGLLVLVGALLMSVATVQFGGHSIF
jgi:hypothetical protein